MTSASGVSIRNELSITSAGTLPVASRRVSGSTRPSCIIDVIGPMWRVSIGVAITARLRIGMSVLPATDSSDSTPPKQ